MEDLVIRPATPGRWKDIETLFGERGACGGCWCMWWRLPRSEFSQGKGRRNKAAFRKLVASGRTPGLIAYRRGEPIGWCAVGPREAYPRLDRSRVLQPVDELPVWSVTCFFVEKAYRRRGVTASLLEAAVELARRKGARIVEGYPIDPTKGGVPDPFAWTGFASAFLKAGFLEVARRSPGRPIMRRFVARDGAAAGHDGSDGRQAPVPGA